MMIRFKYFLIFILFLFFICSFQIELLSIPKNDLVIHPEIILKDEENVTRTFIKKI